MKRIRLCCLLACLATMIMTGSAQAPSGPPVALSYSAALLPGAGANDMAVDAAGKIYLAGTICEDEGVLPVTPNAAQAVHGGGCDGFIAVLGPDRRLVYATYLGGSFQDRIHGVAVDAQGGIYVAGDTTSPDFPTTAGAFDRTCGESGACFSDVNGQRTGANDGFVTKLTSGGAFAYSTYLGGSDTDLAHGIAVDATGSAHVVGSTRSPDYPTTAGAASAYRQNEEATYTVVAPGGSSVTYSTYVAGEGEEHALGVAVDEQGAAYVAGSTTSSALTTFMPLQPLRGGGIDGWLMKVAADRSLKYITYFGGSSNDSVLDVTVRGGFVYLTGTTCSSDLPGAAARDGSGCGAGFIGRIAADGSARDRSAIIEGNSGRSIAVDSLSRAYMLGLAQPFPGSTPFEPTADAFQPVPGPLGSATLVVVPFGGSGPVNASYASYVGDGGPVGEQVLTDGNGGVLLGGQFINNEGPPSFPVVNAPFASPLGRSMVMHLVPESRMIDNVDGEIVMYARDVRSFAGNWRLEVDPSAALGRRLTNPDLASAKLNSPLAAPADYVEFEFTADAGVNYRLWIRGRAAGDHWANDSVFVQFSDSVNQAGAAAWRIGTTTGTAVNLEDCVNCGVRGWGWQDNGYGANVLGTPVRFAGSGTHTIRIQRREDGFSFDQIVLSSSRYMTSAPGPLKQASTILSRSNGDAAEAPPDTAEVVLHVTDASTRGAWAIEPRQDAASGVVVRHPDAGAPKVQSVPVPAVNYFELSFDAEAGRAYRLWIRGRADRDSWANDSVHVQFSDAVTASGTPVWRIGGSSSTEVNLEDCLGCGIRGWGWQDNAWGIGVEPQLVYFAQTGRHVIRVTTREDGFSIDQIVLSSQRYLTSSPGVLKNDTVILTNTQ